MRVPWQEERWFWGLGEAMPPPKPVRSFGAVRAATGVHETGQNRSPAKIEWSLYSVKKTLLDTIECH